MSEVQNHGIGKNTFFLKVLRNNAFPCFFFFFSFLHSLALGPYLALLQPLVFIDTLSTTNSDLPATLIQGPLGSPR